MMYARMTGQHALNNLSWVWTSDEAGDALDWYPGDDVVDIVGRDYYFYPRIADHGSLVASFEKVKEIFGGKKIIALTENGSIPHPDSLQGDGSGWSYFMPWYGDYTMDGWAHDNTAADWNAVMNHEYVITLDEMPGWAGYTPSPISPALRTSIAMPQATFRLISGRAGQEPRTFGRKGSTAANTTTHTNPISVDVKSADVIPVDVLGTRSRAQIGTASGTQPGNQ
jgi:hypothetical protein